MYSKEIMTQRGRLIREHERARLASQKTFGPVAAVVGDLSASAAQQPPDTLSSEAEQ